MVAKRKATDCSGGGKRRKDKNGPVKWRIPKGGVGETSEASDRIEPGDKGIWVTCDMHKEKKCIAEVGDLLDHYISRSISNEQPSATDGSARDDTGDVETEIGDEIRGMQVAGSHRLFRAVKLDLKCVVFFKVKSGVEPTSLVREICMDAASSYAEMKSKWVKRLTPTTLIGKATEKGLMDVATKVLEPHFHGESTASKKFAIRTTLRNHSSLARDAVIEQIASLVGDAHSVDLENYDLLILVDIYKNVCGMSVVGNDYEQLKRYNLAEISRQVRSTAS